jgi:hypothetical protein
MTVSGYIKVMAASVCEKREANSFLLNIGHVGSYSAAPKNSNIK